MANNGSDKDYLEVLPIVFDFTTPLVEGETIVAGLSDVTAEVYTGGDSDPSHILLNAPTTTGNRVTQRLQKGVIGTTYIIRCSIVTSTGRTLVESAKLPVVKRK